MIENINPKNLIKTKPEDSLEGKKGQVPPFRKGGYSKEELKDIALNRGGVVGMVGPEGLDPKIVAPNGWRYEVIGKRKETGEAGKVILKPTTKETNILIRQGRIKFYIDSGLFPKEAQLLDSADGSQVRFKTELASRLASVLQNEAQVKAFLEHPAKYDSKIDSQVVGSPNFKKRKEWVEKFRSVFGDDGTGLTFEREVMLAKMVKAVLQKG